MGQLNLYFLRHGQTQFNVFLRLQGWANSQLTAQGIAVAEETGREFAALPLTAAYTSDLGRAVETGRLFLAQRSGEPLTLVERASLREVGFGYYEGLDGRGVWNIAELRAREVYGLASDAPISEAVKLDMLHELDPAHLAESHEQFTSRLRQGIEEIVAEHEEGNVLIVSHSSAIMALFNLLDPDFETDHGPSNGAMSLMTYVDGRYTVKGYNVFTSRELAQLIED